jgi:hypothetical protein
MLKGKIMWTLESAASRLTNKVAIPTDGKIEVSSTGNTKVSAYINDQLSTPLERLWVQAGDLVHFDIKGDREVPTTVTIQYGGAVSTLEIPPRGPKAATTSLIEEDIMTPADTVNLFANPNQGMGGALGGGLGAGLVGGLLGTMLFRNGRGLDGGLGDGGVPATLQGVESVVNNSAIMSQLADLKAAVPLAEAQGQLALAGAQMDLNSSIQASTGSVIGSISGFQSTVMNNLNMQTQMNQKGFADNQLAIATTGAAGISATKDASLIAERNAWAITQAISNDGDKTRALIQSIDKSNDSRTITNLANEVTELRNERRLHDATGNITISNNNTATAVAQQQQAQQQQQLQYQILAQLGVLNADLQSVKQSSVVFNSGTQTNSGNQAAANTRVA